MKIGEYTCWSGACCCRKCNKIMNDGQLMYNNGVCPFCGNKPRFESTVADYYVVSVRSKRINPIWKFWKRQFELEVKK
jgi:hypothetical protein